MISSCFAYTSKFQINFMSVILMIAEDGDDTLLQNAGDYLQNYMASQFENQN
jgi:hypothetical protein